MSVAASAGPLPAQLGPRDRPAQYRQALARYGPFVQAMARFRWFLVLAGALVSAQNMDPVFGDPIRFAAAATRLFHGDLAGIYADSWMQAGPFELIGTWLMLPMPYQHVRHYVFESEGNLLLLHLILGALLVLLPMLFVRVLRSRHGLPASGAMEFVAGATSVYCGLPTFVWPGGHISQLAAPFFWVWAGSLATRGRPVAAAAFVGLAAGWEPWGLLAAGVLLADHRLRPRWDASRPWRMFSRDDLRLVCTTGAVLVAAAAAPYLPFALAGPFHLFGLHWPIAPDTFVHAVWPHLTTFGYGQRLLQGGLSILAGATVAITLGRRAETVWVAPIAVTVVRLLLDPLNLNHYWMPLLIVVSIGTGLSRPWQERSWGRPQLAVPIAAVTLGLVMVPRLRLTQSIPWPNGWVLLPFAIAFVALLLPLARLAVPEPGRADLRPVKGSEHASLAHRG